MPTAELQSLDARTTCTRLLRSDELAEKARIHHAGQSLPHRQRRGTNSLTGCRLWCSTSVMAVQKCRYRSAFSMIELNYYNTFFMTSHVPPLRLPKRSRHCPCDLNHGFLPDQARRTIQTFAVRTYGHEDKPEKSTLSAVRMPITGSSIGSVRLAA